MSNASKAIRRGSDIRNYKPQIRWRRRPHHNRITKWTNEYHRIIESYMYSPLEIIGRKNVFDEIIRLSDGGDVVALGLRVSTVPAFNRYQKATILLNL
jgi:hypothetical protein